MYLLSSNQYYNKTQSPTHKDGGGLKESYYLNTTKYKIQNFAE